MDVISTFIYKYKSLLRRLETFQFPRFIKKIRETERGVDEKELRVPESEINSQESKMEKIGDERGGQAQAMKSQVAIRCAKAAILLSSLKNSPNNSTSNITLKVPLLRFLTYAFYEYICVCSYECMYRSIQTDT